MGKIENIDLSFPYTPVAIFYEDADTVEYVRKDVPCIQRRVDGILTLNLDLKTKELIGFRVKGFKNFFISHLKPQYELMDADFIPLVSVLERAFQAVGNGLLTDQNRQAAYRQARKMAHEDRVALEPDRLAA